MARPLILDPHRVPLVGRDDHLPAIDATRMSEAALRARFLRATPWQPEFDGDGVTSPTTERPSVHASVLMGLVPHGDTLRVLLTQRTDHLRHHAGQISFPGGRAELFDVDAVATALREAHEEIGLPPSAVDVLGTLPHYRTVTNFVVTPVVAIVQPPSAWTLDANEVDSVFEVPLSFLMTPANHQRHRFEFEGRAREFLSMPWVERDTPVAVDVGVGLEPPPTQRFIWGATAAMLRNLYRLLSA